MSSEHAAEHECRQEDFGAEVQRRKVECAERADADGDRVELLLSLRDAGGRRHPTPDRRSCALGASCPPNPPPPMCNVRGTRASASTDHSRSHSGAAGDRPAGGRAKGTSIARATSDHPGGLGDGLIDIVECHLGDGPETIAVGRGPVEHEVVPAAPGHRSSGPSVVEARQRHRPVQQLAAHAHPVERIETIDRIVGAEREPVLRRPQRFARMAPERHAAASSVTPARSRSTQARSPAPLDLTEHLGVHGGSSMKCASGSRMRPARPAGSAFPPWLSAERTEEALRQRSSAQLMLMG